MFSDTHKLPGPGRGHGKGTGRRSSCTAHRRRVYIGGQKRPLLAAEHLKQDLQAPHLPSLWSTLGSWRLQDPAGGQGNGLGWGSRDPEHGVSGRVFPISPVGSFMIPFVFNSG